MRSRILDHGLKIFQKSPLKLFSLHGTKMDLNTFDFSEVNYLVTMRIFDLEDMFIHRNMCCENLSLTKLIDMVELFNEFCSLKETANKVTEKRKQNSLANIKVFL